MDTSRCPTFDTKALVETLSTLDHGLLNQMGWPRVPTSGTLVRKSDSGLGIAVATVARLIRGYSLVFADHRCASGILYGRSHFLASA